MYQGTIHLILTASMFFSHLEVLQTFHYTFSSYIYKLAKVPKVSFEGFTSSFLNFIALVMSKGLNLHRIEPLLLKVLIAKAGLVKCNGKIKQDRYCLNFTWIYKNEKHPICSLHPDVLACYFHLLLCSTFIWLSNIGLWKSLLWSCRAVSYS